MVDYSEGRLQPKTVMSDFEAGFINAVKETFPDAQNKGCFFHLSQCVMKHVKQDKVVYEKYRQDEEFALKVCKFSGVI